MPSQPNFKTADWTGIVRPDLDHDCELTTLLIRLPKDLADDVALATYESRCWFDSEEEFIATAVSWALRSLAEEPPQIGVHGQMAAVRRRGRHARRQNPTSALFTQVPTCDGLQSGFNNENLTEQQTKGDAKAGGRRTRLGRVS